ncbi:hypothetical protein [Maribacter sp. 2304DJ31-5]|uniref:hypothetical protein n=1 Tax=Maribacter sp. 2304DJ31-5 TaxID=3386273 RepID=UPI0039BD8FC9
MNSRPIIKTCLTILIIILFFSACSNDDLKPGCFQESGRDIVSMVKTISGAIVQQDGCSDIFTIKPDEQLEKNPIGILVPCNLDKDFQIDGKRVIFSGYIYESFDTENICADFFELTEIKSLSQ